MSVDAKICGLTDKAALHACIEGGAAYIGFVCIPSSKRYLPIGQARKLLATLPAPTLCRFTPASPLKAGNEITLTALFADQTDEQIMQAKEALHPFLGLIQLHGEETPERVASLRAMTGLPVMKAIPIATHEDLALVPAYEPVADRLLFDTRLGPTPTGGTGQSFDWHLLKGRTFARSWMLAGGLDAQNVKKAVKTSGANCVDVSSGVETDGKKDPLKIKEFLRVCHDL